MINYIIKTKHGLATVKGYERFTKEGYSAPMGDKKEGYERTLCELFPDHPWPSDSGLYAVFDHELTLDALLGDPTTPIDQLHFYKWLDDNHSKGWNRREDKKRYLKAIGHDKALTQDQIDSLNGIHAQHHYRNR